MLPLQEIGIYTKNKKVIIVSLRKMGQSSFVCEITTINNEIPENRERIVFKGGTAYESYANLICNLIIRLKNDNLDSIISVNNLCNTEIITIDEQSEILGSNINIFVNRA